jgi:hypothetical protein
VLRDGGRMFVFEDFFHSPVDRIRRVFHALSEVDSIRLKQYNIQEFNNMPENVPPKPPLRNRRESRTCPHCKSPAVYEQRDLSFAS